LDTITSALELLEAPRLSSGYPRSDIVRDKWSSRLGSPHVPIDRVTNESPVASRPSID